MILKPVNALHSTNITRLLVVASRASGRCHWQPECRIVSVLVPGNHHFLLPFNLVAQSPRRRVVPLVAMVHGARDETARILMLPLSLPMISHESCQLEDRNALKENKL